MRTEPREADIQKAIMDYLTAVGIKVIRYNTSGFKVGKRLVRAHSAGPGHADLLFFVKPHRATWWMYPRAVFVEVKRPGEKQTPEQVSFEQWLKESNIDYFVAYSIDDVVMWLEKHR